MMSCAFKTQLDFQHYISLRDSLDSSFKNNFKIYLLFMKLSKVLVILAALATAVLAKKHHHHRGAAPKPCYIGGC